MLFNVCILMIIKLLHVYFGLLFQCLVLLLTGMAVNMSNLYNLWQHYVQLGISPSTRKAYQAGLHTYKDFRAKAKEKSNPYFRDHTNSVCVTFGI